MTSSYRGNHMGSVWKTAHERRGGRSSGTAAMNAFGPGEMTLKYTVEDADLDLVLRSGLETVAEDPISTGLQRNLPAAHPRWPWFYVTSYTSIDGVSYTGVTNPDNPPSGGGSGPALVSLDAPTIYNRAEWAEWELTARFAPRPYALLLDEHVGEEIVSYYEDDGTGPLQQAVQKEWARNVEWLKFPGGEFLTAELGQFIYQRLGGGAGLPNTGQGAARGTVKLLVPTATWKCVWHNVPYSWVTNANNVFDKARGRVNQTEWEGSAAGTLLLTATSVVGSPYVTPFPENVNWEGSTSPSPERCCTIEMTMVEKKPPTFETYVTTNKAHIPAGHNLVPYAKNGLWYYVTTNGEGGTLPKPIYDSFPYQFLFMNPDQCPL